MATKRLDLGGTLAVTAPSVPPTPEQIRAEAVGLAISWCCSASRALDHHQSDTAGVDDTHAGGVDEVLAVAERFAAWIGTGHPAGGS